MSRFKQVLVVRNDLNMRKGKMIAQGAHASIMFLVHRLCDAELGAKDHAIQEWLTHGMTKICVRADSEAELGVDWSMAQKQMSGLDCLTALTNSIVHGQPPVNHGTRYAVAANGQLAGAVTGNVMGGA